MANVVPLLTFTEAERVGQEMHDHWALMASDGKAPLDREDMAWADLAQFVLRRASAVVRERDSGAS